MRSERIKLDVIISTFNGAEVIDACLNSVFKTLQGVDFSVTIVNDNSSDNTIAYLGNLSIDPSLMTVYSLPVRSGLCGARNFALARTERDFVLFLDDDAELLEDTFELLFNSLSQDPKIALTGPRILFADKKTIFSADYCLTRMHRRGWGELDQGQRDYCKYSDAVIGTCCLFRRAALRQIGDFDPPYFPGQCEDLDYAIRLRNAGYKIFYCGKAAVIHQHLFRVQNEEQAVANLHLLQTSWRDFLQKYPLTDSHEFDRTVAQVFRAITPEDLQAATNAAQRLEDKEPLFCEPQMMLDLLQRQHLYEQALPYCERALDREPKNPYLLDRTASIYYLAGKNQLAARHKRHALSCLKLLSESRP